jgi:hypothetical protein
VTEAPYARTARRRPLAGVILGIVWAIQYWVASVVVPIPTEASAWVTQKLGRLKFQLGSDLFGIFEALEVLSLGILGKIALWNALQETNVVPESLPIDLKELIQWANVQFESVEAARLNYARRSLQP